MDERAGRLGFGDRCRLFMLDRHIGRVGYDMVEARSQSGSQGRSVKEKEGKNGKIVQNNASLVTGCGWKKVSQPTNLDSLNAGPLFLQPSFRSEDDSRRAALPKSTSRRGRWTKLDMMHT